MVEQSINSPQNIQERYPEYYGLDEDVSPEIPMVGLLGWTSASWEKMLSDGSGNLMVTT